MNDNNTQDRMAHIGAEEIFTAENDGDTTPVPTINNAKLLAHNLRQPMHKRIDAAELQEKVAGAKHRGRMVALHAEIRAECDGVITTKNEALENL